jgi:hypothetical protein
MTGGPLRRLQELAAPDQVEERARSRATKEANLADRLSECNQNWHYDGRPASPTAGARGRTKERRESRADVRRRSEQRRSFLCERRRRRIHRAMCEQPKEGLAAD